MNQDAISMTDDEPLVVAAFPLRGEWMAFHTPAERIPSHGTDQLGQRYAFDFLRIDWAVKGFKFHSRAPLWYAALGVRLDECLGWSAPIHAPFSGVAISASDGWPERQRVHFVRDMAVVLKNAFTFDPKTTDLQSLVGNHIIIRDAASSVHAFIAHARNGSVQVSPGDSVLAGQHIADVGHSGNSTAPHLHFQLMDGPDLHSAKGVPCAFEDYEVQTGGAWEHVRRGIPGKRQRVRCGAS